MVENIGKASQAIGAYLNSAKIADKGISAGQDDSFSFGSLIKGAVDKVVATQKASEAVSTQAVLGNASLTDVVQAVSEAEITLQTVMSVRDRLVAAYQDIMRMPI